tara:strand:- start:272 stop:484 length:213 start_codon:yes stop_codon:yes gene_type:complete
MGSGIHGMVLLRVTFGTITVVQSAVSIFLDGQFGLFGLPEFRDSLAPRWCLLPGVRRVMKRMMNKKVAKP